MSCKNTEETVLAYDPIHLYYIDVLTKRIDNTIGCALYLLPRPLFSIKATDTWN